MSVHRMAVLAATAAAVALPLLSAPSATAAPTVAPASTSYSCPGKPLPYKVHGTNAVTIRSKATTKSTAVGILYKSHKFTVHKTTKGRTWLYITDKNTKKKGWVSGKYVYRDVRMCLD
ncbi:SH3 domain-containing protein [Streptomyces sp. NPDC048420]|uniref:SH3 domain-containing protein n=1 Tax=Streptomyces sp. NPDC048420 TaxID=3155755 RepID=UPI00342F5F73